MAGTFEVITSNEDYGQLAIGADMTFEEVDVDVVHEAEEDNEPSTSTQAKKRMVYKPLSAFGNPKWSSRKGQFSFDIAPVPELLHEKQEKLFNDLKNHTPLQLFELFFDPEMYAHIINETNRYAQQLNSSFKLDWAHLRRFIGIMILSGYHTLPALRDYWSNQPSLGVTIVKQTMPRNKFVDIKRFIHFCDNNTLDKNDKLTKIRPLFELANKKFRQFGCWAEALSIDEQMVPYFGRNSCKMYIRNKPIRFGYKIWCLCSAEGYLFQSIPYAGASDNYNRQVGLGADVVLRLLEIVENPQCHRVFFDNYFTSYYLMCLLNEKRFCATGTARSNRIAHAPLKTGKALARGTHDFAFDATNSILFCRWSDNSEVTVATNFDQIEPTSKVKRWKKQIKKYENHDQPLLIRNYNQGMGGVDLHDNAVENYRINIRGKKWYWPFWIAILSSSIVNAWKLHCFLCKYETKKSMPQKEFRVLIAEQLLLTSDSAEAQDSGDEFQPESLPKVSGDHLIAQYADKKQRRCQLKSCNGKATFFCRKCNICLHPVCFEKYHLDK